MDCVNYCQTEGCSWTDEYACGDWQQTNPLLEQEVAGVDGTEGYYCCCVKRKSSDQSCGNFGAFIECREKSNLLRFLGIYIE